MAKVAQTSEIWNEESTGCSFKGFGRNKPTWYAHLLMHSFHSIVATILLESDVATKNTPYRFDQLCILRI